MNTRRSTMVGLLLAVSISGSAWAEGQSKEQQGCINFLNKGVAKISGATLKAISKCADAYAKDKGVTDPDTCASDAAAVNSAQDKLLEGATTKCATAPTIGPNEGSYTAYQAETAALYLTIDLTGSIETELIKCSDEPVDAGCKCQSAVIKTIGKLASFYLKGFNKCTSSGLKTTGAEQIVDEGGLIACLVDSTKLDPKAKHAKLVEKAKSAITKGCSELVTNPLPNSYDCQNKTGDDLAICIDARTRCRLCAALNDIDHTNLYEACDTFDDGLENNSCFGS